MNIVLLTENFPPDRGGIQNYLEHLAVNLKNDSVTVIAPKVKNAADNNLPGIKIVRRNFFSSLARPKWLWLFISLWKQARAGDINILLCGKALFEGQVGYYLKKYLGIPYVIFTYGMEIEVWQSMPRTKRQLIRVLSKADRVAYINDVTKTALHELGVHEDRLVEILPGVDDKFFETVSSETKTAVLKKYQLTQPYILTVSRLVKRKGIDVLIEAFAKLDQTKFGEVELVIAGAGPENANLIEESEQNLVAPKVKFLGDVPDNDLLTLYSGSCFFALTPQPIDNDIEGFGIVYLEAAACGLPAIGTMIGGIPEAVVNGETGVLVEPNSAEAVTDALGTLLTDETKRRELGQNATKRADQNFRWHKRVQFLKTALKDIVDSTSGGV